MPTASREKVGGQSRAGGLVGGLWTGSRTWGGREVRRNGGRVRFCFLFFGEAEKSPPFCAFGASVFVFCVVCVARVQFGAVDCRRTWRTVCGLRDHRKRRRTWRATAGLFAGADCRTVRRTAVRFFCAGAGLPTSRRTDFCKQSFLTTARLFGAGRPADCGTLRGQTRQAGGAERFSAQAFLTSGRARACRQQRKRIFVVRRFGRKV